jgi:hypothetical protein
MVSAVASLSVCSSVYEISSKVSVVEDPEGFCCRTILTADLLECDDVMSQSE